MKKLSAWIITALFISMMLAGIMPTSIISVEAESPHQDLAGEDYLANAYALEAQIKANAGRQTSNATDGAAWDNQTWDQSRYLASEYLMKNNNDLAQYTCDNVSNSNGVIEVTVNDTFDDSTVASMWTQVTASGGTITEGYQGADGIWLQGAYVEGNYIYKKDWTNNNTYTIRQNRTIPVGYGVAAGYYGGFAIVSGNETMDSLPGNMQIYSRVRYASYWLRIYVYYTNSTGSEINILTQTIHNYWTGMTFYEFNYTIEYNYTHVIVNIWDEFNDAWYNCTPVQRSNIIYGDSSIRNIAFGEFINTNYQNKGTYFQDYTQKYGPATGWFCSPAIATGNTDTRFHSMSWTGGPTEIKMQTANDRLFIYPSALHTIASATSYVSSNWHGAYMRWNVTLNAGQTFDPATFYSYGSCNGIYLNTSETTTRIDRCTTIYGRTITLTHNVLVHPDALSATMYEEGFSLEVRKCDINFATAYYFDPDKNGAIPNGFKFENCTLRKPKVGNYGFVYAGWEAGQDYYIDFINCTTSNIAKIMYTNYPSTYYFCNATHCTFEVRGYTDTLYSDLFNYNKIVGGYNGTGGGTNKWGGVSTRRAKYNWIHSAYGGNGIVFTHNSRTGTGEEWGNVSYNIIEGANYVGLGSYGGDAVAPFNPAGARNCTINFYHNYVNNTRRHPLAGIGYSLSFGYGEENSSFTHNYIFNQAAGSTACSYIHHASVNCSVIGNIFFDTSVHGINFQDDCRYSRVWDNVFIKMGGTCVFYSVGVDYGHNEMGNNTYIWCNASPVVQVSDLGYHTGNETFFECNGTYAYSVSDDASLYIWNSVGFGWSKINSGTINSSVFFMRRSYYRVPEYNIRIIIRNESGNASYDRTVFAKARTLWLIATDKIDGTFTNHTYITTVYIDLDDPYVKRNGIVITSDYVVTRLTFTSPPGSSYIVENTNPFSGALDSVNLIIEALRLTIIPLLVIFLIVWIGKKGYDKISEYA